jgi:hypothetical protein
MEITATQFLALSPVPGTRYSWSVLNAYGRLDEHQDSHGTALWSDESGEVFADDGVVFNNTYRGRRTAPYRIE